MSKKPVWALGYALRKAKVPCAEGIAMMLGKKEANSYLTFASAEPFTLATENAAKNWDGTLYASTDAEIWNEWDGITTIASAEDSGEQRLYVRGVGNSKITTVYYGQSWILTGNNVHCRGNIENLLDHETVAIGQHPTMAGHCFAGLFDGCTSLVSAPELPATALADKCYSYMFQDCTSLVTPPELPATTLASSCYRSMFEGCTSLVRPPELPAITLTDYCYMRMFNGCTSLVALPKLPATDLLSRCYQAMFDGCTNIKVSTTQSEEYHTAYRIPTDGGGTVGYNSMSAMFRETGGTFIGDPQINSTYYTSNEVI